MKRPEANQRQSERRRGESRWRDTAREMKRRGGETLLERWRDEAERHCSRDGETRRRGKSRLSTEPILKGGSLDDVKDIYVEVDQRRVVFDEDVKRHVEIDELEQVSIAIEKQHAEEELSRLRSRFEKWKKDYKARLRGTKARLRLNGHRNWCGKKSF
ncbi:hypothetical protein F2Q69_00034187 [Brassica cretica]|uniref:Uncharacterized protein n=1 Tax=Brassica cretica TaxID=69181 RepID=A0A8S9SGQ3_BRACR|nr:hypothetical protein F2Q69_00034187 [Brassica cretica]